MFLVLVATTAPASFFQAPERRDLSSLALGIDVIIVSEWGVPMVTKIPNPIDKHVGSRVRMRRMLAGISQEKLGDALGLTFQQVQKYEKGSNRISASRLQQIAKMLEVPVSYFFDGAPSGDVSGEGFVDSAATTYISEFLATSEGVQLTKAFTRIKSGRVRRRIIDLVEALAEESDPPEQK